MKRLLFISSFPPNKKTAGQNYTLNLINDLSNEFDIDLIYWGFPEHSIEANLNVKNAQQIKVGIIQKISCILIPLFPLFTRRFSFSTYRNLQKSVNEYDLIYFDFSQTFLYSRFIKHPFKVGMAHDVILQKYSRTKLGSMLRPWIKWSEKICLSKLQRVFTFSYKDKEILKSEYGTTADVVPFYIDHKITDINLHDIYLDDYFVMYGAWNRLENQESINWVISHYPSYNPHIIIIGGSLPESIKQKIDRYPNLKYLGFIDNPYNFIAKSKGLIAPLFHGAGVKVKAIESLALGTPVIGTAVTFEGLPQVDKSMIKLDDDTLDLSVAMSQLNSLTISDKINIQSNFKQTYILESLKEKILSSYSI